MYLYNYSLFFNVFNVLVLLFCFIIECIKYNNSLFFNVLVLLFCLLLIYVFI